MGILRDLWEKITGRNRIQSLPGKKDGEEAKNTDVKKFREDVSKLAQQIGATQISNGDDLITRILTSLGANSIIVNHEAAKETLQTFVRAILAQNNLDTTYWGIEDIEKIIQAIKGIKVVKIKGKDMLLYSKDLSYRIEIENGSIYLQVCAKNNSTKERYLYSINESGNLSVKEMKFEEYLFGYELSEENDIEYNKNGEEQKRRTIKKELDPETNKRTRVVAAFIRVRHPIHHFVVEQNDIVLNGKKVVVSGPKFKLLKLDTLKSLENLDDSGISFQGNPDIEGYYKQNKVTIDAKIKACGIKGEGPGGR